MMVATSFFPSSHLVKLSIFVLDVQIANLMFSPGLFL